MQTQPPPDASNRRLQSFEIDSLLWWKKSGIWIVGILGLVVIFLIFQQPGGRRHNRGDQTEAINNARQIGLAMIEFQEEYGKFPDDTTIIPVQSKTGSLLPMGTKTSNDFFRQLFAADMTQSEAMFYSRIDGTRKPDGIIDGSHLLTKGECGFTYFLGAKKTDNPRRPLVVTPMIPGTDRFDPKRFDGKAVILRLDNSVISLPIDKAGHVILDGRNMMDPLHPIWDGHPPWIAWPDF
jgi:hypothetical protein